MNLACRYDILKTASIKGMFFYFAHHPGLKLEPMIPTDQHGSRLDFFLALCDPQKGGETGVFLAYRLKRGEDGGTRDDQFEVNRWTASKTLIY
jgi:hypothetical protein